MIQIDQAEFAQIASALKAEVQAAALVGLDKVVAKRRRFDDEAMRIIAGIPSAVAFAIERMEPAHGGYFNFLLLADCRWNGTYRPGHMPYDTTTSVVMAFCREAGLNPYRIESETGWSLQITVKLPWSESQLRTFRRPTRIHII